MDPDLILSVSLAHDGVRQSNVKTSVPGVAVVLLLLLLELLVLLVPLLLLLLLLLLLSEKCRQRVSAWAN
eukprot:SAG11_NODE_1910_length_4079_cov_3.969095_1_plen_70_part_00